MSDEVVKEETKELYVHQIGYDVLLQLLANVTDVNKLCTYNMPNKAEKYADNSFDLINILNEYIGGEEEWRVTRESDVKFGIKENLMFIGDWVINGVLSCICLPKINSIIIIPNNESTCKGVKEPTKILHLINCIAVTPLLIKLTDEPINDGSGKFNLGMKYEPIAQLHHNEKPTE